MPRQILSWMCSLVDLSGSSNDWPRHIPGCSCSRADRRVATSLFATSNTLVLTKPSGLVELTGRLAASYPSVVRLPSGSTDATSRFAKVKYI